MQIIPIAKLATRPGLRRDVRYGAGRRSTVVATVASAKRGFGVPTGSVAFYDNGVLLAKRPVASGSGPARHLPSLTARVHVIGVRYTGTHGDWLTSKTSVQVTVS